MRPEHLPILLILFERGYYINIFGSHFIYFLGGGSRARAKAKGGWFKGKGEGWVVQGQGRRWFKGKYWGN